MLVGSSLRGGRFFRCLYLFLILLAGLISPAKADGTVRKAPEAGWIKLVDVPSADPARFDQIRNGLS
jgi:hypothetical protein